MNLDRPSDVQRDESRPGKSSAYRRIEWGLWALAPAILVITLLQMLSTITAGDQARVQLESEIRAENRGYCEKWGMPVGTAVHAACMRDLRDIRDQTEQRVREDLAANF
ncbi:MAG TPA: hypothetical protein VFX06_00080 [Stellaceae bacterium]|nr:hypothetical protein [Stellaceae bacterium]